MFLLDGHFFGSTFKRCSITLSSIPGISSCVQANMSRFFFRNSIISPFIDGSSSPPTLVIFEGPLPPFLHSLGLWLVPQVLPLPSKCDFLWKLELPSNILELTVGLYISPNLVRG